ncbi:unnamed protein product [Taenia asiatica]|uniref:Uncharacterized protein n=1 Tax=Taenia asiatica TaxID=60517 RepID=A0A0R3WDY7_TAEAS|nr:unnamed protein product [Taenia asiatica]
MIHQGDVMEHSPSSSMPTNAKAYGLTKVELRNGFQRCRIDELANQVNKQNGSKTFRRLHGPFSKLTPLEAFQFIKARGPNIIDRLPPRTFKPAPTKATHDVSQAPSMWFAVKRRQPEYSRILIHYIVTNYSLIFCLSLVLSTAWYFSHFSASDLTSSPLTKSIPNLTPILETYETPAQTSNKGSVPMHPRHQQEQQKQQFQQKCLNFVKNKDAANGAVCPPLADASNSICGRGSIDAIRPHTGSNQAIPLSSVDAPGVTETLQATIPSCKTTSDVTPRQSAYKEPSDHRVHKKVRLAILVHPTATPPTCAGSKRDIATPYHSSTTNSFSESLTDCIQSVTTFSSGGDNPMPDLDSCILDDQPIDVSEAYDINGDGEGAFKKGYNEYQEGEVKEKQGNDLEEEKVQNTLTHITPPSCPSLISECSPSTTSTGLLDQRKEHESEDLFFNENESPGMPRVVQMYTSNKPQFHLRSHLEQIDSLSEEVSNAKSYKRESNSSDAMIEPFQTDFIVGMEGGGSLSASLEPTIRTLQDHDEVVVEVSYLPPSLHRIPGPLSPDHLFWNKRKRAVMEESGYLKWVLKRANVSMTEMNTVVMHAAPNVLQCTKHRLPQIREAEDTTLLYTNKIHSELMNPYDIGIAETSAP